MSRRDAPDSVLDLAISLFKKSLDDGDSSPLHAMLDALSPAEKQKMEPRFAAFLTSERARLIKLRTLGLTQGFDARVRLIDALLARRPGSAGEK